MAAVLMSAGLFAGPSIGFANTISIYDAAATATLLGKVDSDTGSTDTFLGFLGVNGTGNLPNCPSGGCSTSTSLAYAVDGTPAAQTPWELNRLNILAGTSLTTAVQGFDWVTETTGTLTGYLKFTIDTEYFSLKIGNLAAYFRNDTGVPLVLWYLAESGAGAGLSHYTEYGPLLPGGIDPAPVPLPAGVLLFLTGLAGLGAAKRIRSKAV
ncbi:MAG: VPLPA-CTERM sorting domain-containing protein [Paracoccaceae bacterium]